MKKLTLLLLAGLLGFSACDKDEPNVGPGGTELLRLDGENSTSPILDPGFYEHAVKFPTSLTSLYDGDLLTGVQVHMYDVPSDLEIVVYTVGNSASAPGGVLYEGTVSGLRANAVNDILFETADQILIGRSDLWIAVAYTTSGGSQVVGCDAGPRDTNGDYLKDNNTWTTFQDFTGGESINWNIRGIVQRQ